MAVDYFAGTTAVHTRNIRCLLMRVIGLLHQLQLHALLRVIETFSLSGYYITARLQRSSRLDCKESMQGEAMTELLVT
jgi:hypothetical protein